MRCDVGDCGVYQAVREPVECDVPACFLGLGIFIKPANARGAGWYNKAV